MILSMENSSSGILTSILHLLWPSEYLLIYQSHVLDPFHKSLYYLTVRAVHVLMKNVLQSKHLVLLCLSSV